MRLRANQSQSRRSTAGNALGPAESPTCSSAWSDASSLPARTEILGGIDVEATIAEIMKKGSLTLKQRTLADLMDRAWARSAQALSVSGAVVHAHWTPGKYSHLTDEEFAKLAELSAKALAPASPNAGLDGRGFQIESSTAIEAEVMAPKA